MFDLHFDHWIWPVLLTFAASLVPGLELRAGIPMGVALGLSMPLAVGIAVLGSIVQVGAALSLVNWAYRHAHRFSWLQRWLTKTEALVLRHRKLIVRYGWIGLTAFVLLPFPGTGVWGGMVLARLIQLSVSGIWLGLSLGILFSGLMVGATVHGAITLWRWL